MAVHWLTDPLALVVLGIMGLGMLVSLLDCLRHARRRRSD